MGTCGNDAAPGGTAEGEGKLGGEAGAGCGSVRAGARVCDRIGVGAGVCVRVGVGAGVCDRVGVGAGVWDRVGVGAGVCEPVGVGDGVRDPVGVGAAGSVVAVDAGVRVDLGRPVAGAVWVRPGVRAAGAEAVLPVALGDAALALPCGAVTETAGVAPVLVRGDLPVAAKAAGFA